MKKQFLLYFVLAFLLGMNLMGASYYVATSGNDSNNGSIGSPLKTLEKAVTLVQPGDYIYLRGGTYNMTVPSLVIDRSKSGSSSAMIRVHAYGSETPVLRFDGKENSSSRGIVQDAAYWHWKGITIERAGDNGMLLSGSNNIIEDCVFRENCDTGLQLSRYSTSANSISQWPSNNLIVGCESYNNKDSDNEDADGFAAKLTSGTGNVFRNCVAHHNIDDGWDMYTKSDTGPIGAVLLENCIAHNNGTLTDGVTSGGGDKNGFKLGSSSNKVNHILRRCIAFNNGKHGFTDNGNVGSIEFTNLTAYNNGDYNFHTRDNASHVFKNCVSFNGGHTDRIVGNFSAPNALTATHTSWPYSASSSDFVTMSPGPNNAPTSNGFLNLKSGSRLIDAGVGSTGITYSGSAPDLGAIESGGAAPVPTFALTTNVQGAGSVSPSSGNYASGANVSLTATPSTGYTFSYWSGDASGSSNPLSVTMNANKNITAVFVASSNGGGTTPPPVGGDAVVHNFTTSGTSSSFFNISGNLSTSKGTVVYNGLTLTQCLKIESSTSISFTSTSAATLTLVFNGDFNGKFKVDGASYSASSGVLSLNLAAGSHTLSKDNVANLYYMSLSAGGTGDQAGDQPGTPGGDSGGSSSIVSGTTYKISARHSGLALDVDGHSTEPGANVQTWAYLGGANQQWVVSDAGAGYYRLSPAHAPDLGLDVFEISSEAGANINLWTYWGGEGQQYQLRPTGDGYYTIVARNSGMCLDVLSAGTENGTNVIQWNCTEGSAWQQFKFEPVTVGDGPVEPTPASVQIQENQSGFCGVEGSVDNDNSGFTGSGFANTDNASGKGINYSINASGGSATLEVRYANGASDRPARVVVNGNTAVSSLSMPGTGSWTSWNTVSVSVHLSAGVNSLRIEALDAGGLANIDYIVVAGNGVSAASCSSDNGNTNPDPEPDPDPVYNGNVDFSMIGYATVNAEGYATTTGGAGGATRTISSLSELEAWAASREGNTSPEVVYINGRITSSSSTVVTIKHGANISILGIGSTAELQNVGLNIRNYQNVIVRNLKIREVLYPNDALTIDECHHVWVDHCELHSKIGAGIGVDTYDGLLDIKKGSRYVTVSWCYLHDHMKCSLIGHTNSSSAQSQDSQMRITYHHNYFYNTDGRNPSLRYGAIHMFNNYFNKIGDYGLAARVGAHALVENNHYHDVKLPLTTDKFPVSGLPNGYICERGNLFTGNCGANEISQSDCGWWNLPYNYTLDPASSVATVVPANVGVGKIASLKSAEVITGVAQIASEGLQLHQNHPNPVDGSTTFTFNLDKDSEVTLTLYDMKGRKIAVLYQGILSAGSHSVDGGNAVAALSSGAYVYRLQAGTEVRSKMLIKR